MIIRWTHDVLTQKVEKSPELKNSKTQGKNTARPLASQRRHQSTFSHRQAATTSISSSEAPQMGEASMQARC